MHNDFFFSGPNTHCALVVGLAEKSRLEKQYGYRKWGTHARVFSQTLANWNSNNKIRERNKRGVKMKRSKAGTKEKRNHYGLNYPPSKYNNSKHNLLVFCKRWKKHNEIKLTKTKWTQIIENDKSSIVPRVLREGERMFLR